jgi:hypothetical protein
MMGPLFKRQLYNDQPFKHDLPTDKSFIIAGQKDFEKEKQHLIRMIQSFSETNMSDEPHPFFGKLIKQKMEQRNLETFRSSPTAIRRLRE